MLRAHEAPTAVTAPGIPLGEQDVYLFREGTHAHLDSVMGCHLDEAHGATFRLWAPNAERVSVIGE